MFFPIGIPLQRVPHGGDLNVFSFLIHYEWADGGTGGLSGVNTI